MNVEAWFTELDTQELLSVGNTQAVRSKESRVLALFTLGSIIISGPLMVIVQAYNGQDRNLVITLFGLICAGVISMSAYATCSSYRQYRTAAKRAAKLLAGLPKLKEI